MKQTKFFGGHSVSLSGPNLPPALCAYAYSPTTPYIQGPLQPHSLYGLGSPFSFLFYFAFCAVLMLYTGSLFGIYFYVLITIFLMSYNLYTKQSAHLKCAIRCFLIYLQAVQLSFMSKHVLLFGAIDI